ncbi:L,D-transpeptidase family protein [Clostridium arbusti]|uniref:L,D-transpeptidase family protein n=1 Tax=Clostridium arbusti TaxID=1137848 RepID=UPI0002887066|nr:L,D-transpeptidase/peptidoglycan binding protein [Clostridium arbusti]
MKIINRCNKITAGIIVCLCTLFTVYFMFSIYFMNHLYFGSKINGTDVSGKTVEEIKAQMTSELNTYSLNIKERGGKKEQINAGDINLKYKSDEQFKSIKDEQNPLKWPSMFFSKKHSNMIAEISYDKGLLTKQVDNLSGLADSNIIEPKEPSFKYVDNAFMIVDEIKGNRIDKNILLKRVVDAISKQESTIDLESSNCYITPKYTSKSQKVIKAKDMLNKYVSSKVTYDFGDSKEILNGSIINKWLKVDDNFNVILDGGKVKEYVESLANTYNTAGKARSFHTSSGNTINISGGDYGWQINVDKEVKDLSEAIKEGQTVTKKPAYSKTALSQGSSDIGNTYVEIDMTKQHLWFYKNGSLVVEGDVVTGNVSLNDATPVGIYRLKYKEKNATLKGEGYSSPVSYWMPFNGGIGIHDANWRSVFGGDIYKTNGSHGCINSPYNLAQTIFDNINAGTPVVCYY